MNNVKKISLYAVIIAATIMPKSSRAGWLMERLQQLFPGVGVSLVKASDKAFTQHKDTVLQASEKLGADGFKHLAKGLDEVAGAVGDKIKDGMVEGLANAAQHVDPTLLNQAAGTLGDTLGEKLKEAAPDVALKAAERIAPALEYGATALGVGVAIYGAVQVVSKATDVYNHFNPDEEKKARINAAMKSNKVFDIEEDLQNCLTKNPRTQRNNEGFPVACQNFSDAYRRIAGKAALNEIVTNFKDTYAYKGY